MSWDWGPQDRAALSRFLVSAGLASAGLDAAGLDAGSLDIRRIGDGHSNLTYAVSVPGGGPAVVVRRPPPPPVPAGAHDVLREARLVGALGGSAVPVPRLLATAQPGEVLDVPLYVMSYADGPVVTTGTPPPLARPAVRREIGLALAGTLADLHAVDWRAAGLAGLSRPGEFNQRHLHRVGALAAGPDGQLPPSFRGVADWLAGNVPPDSRAAVVHNDYRLGNVVLAPQPPGRIAAVLDWELATIGDPLFDLGYFLMSVPEPGTPRTPVQEFGTALLEDGYPGRAELTEHYAARTGADLAPLGWHCVFAQWKLAALYEYGRRRAVRGEGDSYYADPALVASFLRAARAVAGIATAGCSETDGK